MGKSSTERCMPTKRGYVLISQKSACRYNVYATSNLMHICAATALQWFCHAHACMWCSRADDEADPKAEENFHPHIKPSWV